MVPEVNIGTRARLLIEAARQVAAAPGEEISLRAVCKAVGVEMPTLYHFFGSKQELISVLVEDGFDQYLALKTSQQTSGDPVQDLRLGWDAHVAFGLTNPGIYILMFGKVRPGYLPEAQARLSRALHELVLIAADQGRLAVSPEQATEHMLATNVGLTLRLISLATPDWNLSAAVREGVLTAITGSGTEAASGSTEDRRTNLHRTLEYAAANQDVLGEPETQLLTKWLRRLATGDRD